MIKSMTGFGAAELTIGGIRHRVEVRTVNSKYLDVKAKLPYELSSLEIRLTQEIRNRLSRGRIEVQVSRDPSEDSTHRDVKVNFSLAESYFKAFQALRHKFGINQEVNLTMICNAKEVITIQTVEEDNERLWSKMMIGLEEALKSVVQMREAEGHSLAVDMAGRCNLLRELTTSINKMAPVQVDLYKKKLEEKIAQLHMNEIDQGRLSQEVCYFADRCDITEEITRLKSHIQQFLKFLEATEPVGRKLDFLVQEMAREANTIGSKCNSAQIAQVVVEVKSELEKLREQIQNVE